MDELPTAEQARTHLKDKAQEERITAKFNKLIEKDREALKQRRDTRRVKLLSERQQLKLIHRQERLALHAAQKSETGNLLNRVASKVFALIFRMPALRSVIAYLHINPLVSLAERHGLRMMPCYKGMRARNRILKEIGKPEKTDHWKQNTDTCSALQAGRNKVPQAGAWP